MVMFSSPEHNFWAFSAESDLQVCDNTTLCFVEVTIGFIMLEIGSLQRRTIGYGAEFFCIEKIIAFKTSAILM